MAYVYGLFYEDGGDNVCYYIGSGKGNRLKEHFKPSQLKKHNYKNNKTKDLRKKGKDPWAKKLVEDLNRDLAFEIEQRLFDRDEVWNELTNLTRTARISENNPMQKDKVKKRYSESVSGYYNENLHTTAQLSEEDAGEIKWLEENTELEQKQIAALYGIDRSTVSRIGNEKIYDIVSASKPDKEFASEEFINNLIDIQKTTGVTGENNGNTKLNDERAAQLKWLAQHSEMTYKQIGNQYGVTEEQVGRIKREEQRGYLTPKKP